METKTALSRLPALIKAKRRKEKLGLRAAAVESGISPSTLSRLERGISPSLPDTDTLTKITDWLEISFEDMLTQSKSHMISSDSNLTTTEAIEVHLRADKDLKPETAKALSDMFKLIYNQFLENQSKK